MDGHDPLQTALQQEQRREVVEAAAAAAAAVTMTTITTIPPAVARTSGSAAVCKWSLFCRGYLQAWELPPQTEALLLALASSSHGTSTCASPPSSQSPLAHRCYHLRACVVLETLRRFFGQQQQERQPVSSRCRRRRRVVVALGAGVDGLALASLARALEQRRQQQHDKEEENAKEGGLVLVEVDAPEVVARKQRALAAFAEQGDPPTLLAALAAEAAVEGSEQQDRRCYHLRPADLRELGSVAAALVSCGVGGNDDDGDDAEVLFVLEAVLGYLPPTAVDALLRWIATAFPRNAAVLVVDSGLVASLGVVVLKEGSGGCDAVARHVLEAFAARGCPLTGLASWGGSPASIVRTLRRRHGFAQGWASDLWEGTGALVPSQRLHICPPLPEPFDEYAALQSFARQSLVAIAATAAPSLFEALTSARATAVATAAPSPVDAGGEAAAAAYTIRRYEPGDAVAVRRLVEAGRAGAAVGRPAVVRFLAKALDRDLRDMEARYQGRFWVMEETTTTTTTTTTPASAAASAPAAPIVGCVGLHVAAGQGEGEVVRLTVASDRQGRGLGSQLLAHAEACAAGECGLASLWVTTLDEAALPGAMGFYRKHGYALEGTHGFGGGGGGGGGEGRKEGDLVRMSKALASSSK